MHPRSKHRGRVRHLIKHDRWVNDETSICAIELPTGLVEHLLHELLLKLIRTQNEAAKRGGNLNAQLPGNQGGAKRGRVQMRKVLKSNHMLYILEPRNGQRKKNRTSLRLHDTRNKLLGKLGEHVLRPELRTEHAALDLNGDILACDLRDDADERVGPRNRYVERHPVTRVLTRGPPRRVCLKL